MNKKEFIASVLIIIVFVGLATLAIFGIADERWRVSVRLNFLWYVFFSFGVCFLDMLISKNICTTLSAKYVNLLIFIVTAIGIILLERSTVVKGYVISFVLQQMCISLIYSLCKKEKWRYIGLYVVMVIFYCMINIQEVLRMDEMSIFGSIMIPVTGIFAYFILTIMNFEKLLPKILQLDDDDSDDINQ